MMKGLSKAYLIGTVKGEVKVVKPQSPRIVDLQVEVVRLVKDQDGQLCEAIHTYCVSALKE